MTKANDWRLATHWTDLLDQDEVWKDGTGAICRLDDMDPGYCSRVRAFVLRQADAVYDLIGMQAASASDPSGEQASIDVDRAFDSYLDAGDNPTAWLESTPLLEALKNRAAGLPAQAARCHCGYLLQDETGSWDHSACYPGIIVD